MNKITIYTFDEVKVIDFTVTTLYTLNTKKKLKKNELHAPKAAKLIVETEDILYAFLMQSPIIEVNSKGDIFVYTTSTTDQISLNKAFELKEDFSIEDDQLLKLLVQKEKLGLLMEELYLKDKLQENKEIKLLLDKKAPFEIGGGF